MDQEIEGLLTGTGQWVSLASWDSGVAEFDADGWIDTWGPMLDVGIAKMPNGGAVNLSHFSALRKVRG